MSLTVYVYIYTRTVNNEIVDQQVRPGPQRAVALFREEAEKHKIHLFGGEFFCDSKDLARGKEYAAGDLEPTGTRIHVRRCVLE